MKAFLLPFILALPGFVLAASDPVTAPADPVLEKVTAATKKQDWASAQAMLRDALAADPQNANYHNLYAYSVRKGASPDMNLVFKHYNEALRIDPKHRGAHEYIGEAYLMVGNVAKAKEHLAQLDKLCFFSCSEFTDLKKAIAAHEQQKR
jgi:tetratricopeptide (TPR) repeat protein